MAADTDKIVRQSPSQTMVQSEGFPIAYANVANVAASFHDIRVFFAEVFPKELTAEVGAGPYRVRENIVAPRICVAMSPEFARAVRDALDQALIQYQEQFGSLRANPQSASSRNKPKP